MCHVYVCYPISIEAQNVQFTVVVDKVKLHLSTISNDDRVVEKNFIALQIHILSVM